MIKGFCILWILCGAVGYAGGLAHKVSTCQRISAEDIVFEFLMIFMAGSILLFIVFFEWRNDAKDENSK
jgi:hypothetical protein